jgi:hypothetical protein
MKLRFSPRAELIIIPTEVFGPKGSVVAQLALDTGASFSVLGWKWFLALGYDPAKVKERVQITTGSGVEFVPELPVRRMTALGRRRANFPFLVHDLPPTATVDGVLGLDFFRGQRLIVDFRKGIVQLN